MPLSSQPEAGRLDIEASAESFRAVLWSIVDDDRDAVTGWSGSDTLSVQVWPGDDRLPLTGTGVTATWSDAPNGIVKITCDGTHTLAPNEYQWRLMATNGGVTYEVVRGVLKVLIAPGSTSNTPDPATAPYTTFDDLLTVASWIGQLRSEHDRSGLMEHQEAARIWLDGIVKRSYRSAGYGQIWSSGLYPVGWGDWPCDGPPKWLMDVLATGTGVKLTPEVKRACALYACYSACAAQVTVKQEMSQYELKASRFRQMAADEIQSTVIYIKSSTTATDWTIPVRAGVATRN